MASNFKEPHFGKGGAKAVYDAIGAANAAMLKQSKGKAPKAPSKPAAKSGKK